jgi:LemA protein
MELLIVLAVVLVIGLLVIVLYNGLVRRRLSVDEGWAQIDVQLKRRHDLIPNLVNAVRDYMKFEEAVLVHVTEARANAIAAGTQGPAQAAQAESQLTGALRTLFAVAEAYPELRASENVSDLQEQIQTTENQIAFSRQHYNATVLEYNTVIATFPSIVLAGPFGFTAREFFEAEPEAAAVPEVRLR